MPDCDSIGIPLAKGSYAVPQRCLSGLKTEVCAIFQSFPANLDGKTVLYTSTSASLMQLQGRVCLGLAEGCELFLISW